MKSDTSQMKAAASQMKAGTSEMKPIRRLRLPLGRETSTIWAVIRSTDVTGRIPNYKVNYF